LWFLICLFIVESLFFTFKEIVNKYLLFICVFILFPAIGYLLILVNYRLSFGLDIALIGLTFYALGYWIKKNRILDYIYMSKFNISILFLINTVFGILLNERISLYHFYFGNFVYFYISAIAGILFWMMISKNIGISKILEYYGQNTLLILSTQYMLFLAFRIISMRLFSFNYVDMISISMSICFTIFTLIIYIPIIFIFNKYFSFIVRKNVELKNVGLQS